MRAFSICKYSSNYRITFEVDSLVARPHTAYDDFPMQSNIADLVRSPGLHWCASDGGTLPLMPDVGHANDDGTPTPRGGSAVSHRVSPLT